MRNTRRAFGDAPAYFPAELMITPRAPRVQGGDGSEGSSTGGVAGSLLKGVKDAGKAAGKVFTRGKGNDTETGHRRMLGR